LVINTVDLDLALGKLSGVVGRVVVFHRANGRDEESSRRAESVGGRIDLESGRGTVVDLGDGRVRSKTREIGSENLDGGRNTSSGILSVDDGEGAEFDLAVVDTINIRDEGVGSGDSDTRVEVVLSEGGLVSGSSISGSVEVDEERIVGSDEGDDRRSNVRDLGVSVVEVVLICVVTEDSDVAAGSNKVGGSVLVLDETNEVDKVAYLHYSIDQRLLTLET